MQATFFHGEPLMIDYTPGSAVSAGDVVVQGDAPMIAHVDIAANRKGALALGGGVYKVAADGAIGILKRVFWDDSANKVTLTASGNKPFGWTITAASTDGDLIYVAHDPGDMSSKQAAVVAAVAGTLTGTVDGTIADIAATAGSCAGGATPTATQVDTAIATAVATIVTGTNLQLKELQTTLNAVIAALKAAGHMATS